MGAVTEVAEVHPDTKDLPSKNRVWGFRTPARYRIRKSATQVAESRRENAPTPTNIASGISQFLLTDQVGTLRAVADSTGTIVKRVDYDSFGNIIADTNPGFSVPFGFAGGLHDRDTGLVRFGARDYDPAIGRWTAKDPIDFAGGDTNLYAYVTSDPISFADPFGLLAFSTGFEAAGGLFGWGGFLGIYGNIVHDSSQPLTKGWSSSLSLTAGGGPAAGAYGFSVAPYVGASTACHYSQLEGPFDYLGRAGFGNAAVGLYRDPASDVWGGGLSLGKSWGYVGAMTGKSMTWTIYGDDWRF